MSKENIKAESIFGGLFGGLQSEKAKEDYLRALEEAARFLETAAREEAARDTEASNNPASNQKESEPKCWIK